MRKLATLTAALGFAVMTNTVQAAPFQTGQETYCVESGSNACPNARRVQRPVLGTRQTLCLTPTNWNAVVAYFATKGIYGGGCWWRAEDRNGNPRTIRIHGRCGEVEVPSGVSLFAFMRTWTEGLGGHTQNLGRF